MFLFTTPTAAPREAGAATSVVDAIRQGADRTGVPFDYLLATAKRESALDPAAKAPTSSATGLFQFIEQTWLGVMKKAGAQVGLSGYAEAISARSDGSLTVGDPGTRQAILDLRRDPNVSSVMAGVLTQSNRDSLVASLGREPSGGELYAAHVLGARGASDLVRAAAERPASTAAADFPEAAGANRGIFYDRSGRARSAAEVYAVLGSNAAGLAAGQTPQATGSTEAAPSIGPGLNGLFQTGRRAGPVSDAVARIWRVNNGVAPRATGERSAAFFPRSDIALPDGDAAPAAIAGAAPVADGGDGEATITFGPAAPVPLPPARPGALDAARRGRRA